MLALVKKNHSALEIFYRDPSLPAFRRLKAELAHQGLSVEQALPDLAAFLAWKGKAHLYQQLLMEK